MRLSTIKRWRKKVACLPHYEQDVAVADSPVVLSINKQIMYFFNISLHGLKLLADDLGMTAHRNFYWRFAHNFEDIHSLGRISIASLNVSIKQYRN